MSRRRKALSILFGMICASAGVRAYDEINLTYYPLLAPPNHLYVAAIWGTPNAIGMPADADSYHRDVVMLESLAGVLLKQGNTNGVFVEANADHQLILQQLVLRRGITRQYVVNPQTPWTIVNQFKSAFGSKYVLYDLNTNPDSLNVARMAAYRFNAIIVDKVLEPTAIAQGLSKIFDCSDKNDQWFHDNWWPTWERKDLAVEQVNLPLMAQYRCLNDYAAAVGAPVFYDGADTALRRVFLNGLDDDSPVLGWGDFDEIAMTTAGSIRSTFINAANYCYNLALLSSFRIPDALPLHQKTNAPVATENNVHYVTFVWTDGDNLQWFHNGFLTSAQWWSSPQRGLVPIGWGIAPSMRDLGPTILEQLYNEASTGTGRDSFVAMSPVGYCYPSMFTAAARRKNAERLSRYMGDIDAGIAVLIDNSGFDLPEVYEPYLAQPNIDALFYWDVLGDYAKYGGTIKWLNGKPLVSARIWMRNLNGTFVGPTQVAADINSRPRNPALPQSYSMVPVHAWSMSVSDIVQCAGLLNPAVRVVTPRELVRLMMTNLAPQIPTVSSNPQNQVLRPGASTNLIAVASGAPALSYQWYLNGNRMTGSTSTNLALNGIALNQSGTYQLVASNAVGMASSAPAHVTVQLTNYFPAGCVEAPAGLVHLWPGDGNAFDLIGEASGSLLRGTLFAAGKVGAAFSFNGTSNYAAIPFRSNFDFDPASQFTLMAWVRAQPKSQFQAVIVKSPPSGEWDWGIWIDSGNRFMAGLDNQHILTSTTLVQAGLWNHVALIYSNRNWTFAINGVVESQASGVSLTRSSGALAFGRKGETISNPSFLQGLIDEVMLFSRALHTNEVRAIYLADSGGVCKPIHLGNPSLQVGENIQILVEGPPAVHYEIESSTNLLNWASWKVVPNPTGKCSVLGTNGFSRTFFRAFVSP